jgi:hypothetical protein
MFPVGYLTTFSQYRDDIASMLGWMNDELEETWKETAVTNRGTIPASAWRGCGGNENRPDIPCPGRDLN